MKSIRALATRDRYDPKGKRQGHAAGEETAQDLFRHKVTHPGIPAAVGDGRDAPVQDKRHDQDGYGGGRAKEERDEGNDDPEEPCDNRSTNADQSPVADIFNNGDGGHLD